MVIARREQAEGADRWEATRRCWPIADLDTLCPPGAVQNSAV